MSRQNLIAAPSFELAANLTAWTAVASGLGNRTISRETSGTGSNGTVTPRAGSYYAFVNRGSGTGNLNMASALTPTVPGKQYAASVWVNRDGTAAMRCDIDWYNASGTYLSSSSGTQSTPADDTWTRISAAGTAPAGAVQAKLFFVVLSYSATQYVRWDAALLEPDTLSVATYGDGDSSGWLWSGTPHASASYAPAALTTYQRRNLVPNPSFEVDLAGWTASGTSTPNFSKSTGFPVAGTSSANASATVAGFTNITADDMVAVTAGLTYALSGYVRTFSGSTAVYAIIRWHNSSGTYLSQSFGSVPGATGSARVSIVATAPTGATQAQLQFQYGGGTGAGSNYLEAVLFERASDLRSYFDGDSSTAEWDGPAHRSTSTQTSTAPTAAAGADQAVVSGDVVSLNGSASSDPEGGALGYAWTVQNAGGTGLTNASITNRLTVAASFTAPTVSSAASITVRLTVTDEVGLTSTDDVVIAVAPGIDLRSGTGWAGPLGLSAAASGAKRANGSGTARHGVSASAAGTARRQSHGAARFGVSGRAAGVKRGIGTGWSPPIGVTTRGSGPKVGIGTGWAPDIVLGGYALPPPPVPQFNGRPLAEDPLPLASSRYLVQNILTGRWLHTDLPLSDDTTKLTLSGPCEISGKITPEYADLTAPGGGPLLRSWGHVVYLEMDGEVRAAGLITEDSYDDQTQSLVCQGVSAYPSFTNYQGNYRRYFADPLTVASEMWGYVQGFRNANLGVTVTRTGGVPTVLYGAKVNPIPGDTLLGLKYGERPAGAENEQDPPTLPVAYKNTLPAVWSRLIGMGYRGKPNDKQEALYVRKADLERAYTDYFLTPGQPHGLTMANPPDATSSVTIEPFKVDWWDAKWCGEIIADSVKALPADYVEQYGWNYPHTFVEQRVMFAYPRLGRRRTDLRFVQGENIVEPVSVASDPDSYGTVVVGTGAGEGSQSLRETAEVILPERLRKTVLYRNSKLTDRAALARLVRDRLTQVSTGGYDISSIVVRASHVNAAFGSYSVGDDILVQAEVPHYGWIKLWCRVLSMTLARGADLVEIALRRSDSFYYGREVEST